MFIKNPEILKRSWSQRSWGSWSKYTGSLLKKKITCPGLCHCTPNITPSPPQMSYGIYCVTTRYRGDYIKIAFISHWNDLWLNLLGKCVSWRSAKIDEKNSNFDIFESALYMKSGSMPALVYVTALQTLHHLHPKCCMVYCVITRVHLTDTKAVIDKEWCRIVNQMGKGKIGGRWNG